MNHHRCLINKARFDTLNLSRGVAAEHVWFMDLESLFLREVFKVGKY